MIYFSLAFFVTVFGTGLGREIFLYVFFGNFLSFVIPVLFFENYFSEILDLCIDAHVKNICAYVCLHICILVLFLQRHP